MITALGGDFFSSFLRDNMAGLGIDFSMSVVSPGDPSSVYLYITDDTGDMHVAVNDMEIVSRITPEHIEKHLAAINTFDAAVIDTNLTQETIEYICNNVTVPIYADPVSIVKAGKLKKVLHRLYCIKPNLLEAEALTGLSSPDEAVEYLYRIGIPRPFISAGTAGMTSYDGSRPVHIPSRLVRAVDATGAGDAAVAALVYAGIRNMPLAESGLLAAEAGALTVSCKGANNPNLGKILM